VCAYQHMLTRVFERVHPACFVQHPLFPLSHKAYVLLKANQSVPPACQCADPHQSTHILYTCMHTSSSKGPVLPTSHVSLLNIAVFYDAVQRTQLVSKSRLLTASIPCS